MVNVKYCKVQISNELSWFNHSFIIISQLLTMPKKGKIKSINVSKKWKQWKIINKSKTSIVLSYNTDNIWLYKSIGKLKGLGQLAIAKMNELRIHTIADIQLHVRHCGKVPI